MSSLARWLGILLVASALGFGCGGGGSTSSAKSADDVADDGDDPVADETDEGATESEPTVEADPCEDGGCMPCGEGLCPEGFYCDESAASGPGCGWLPECAKSPSCSCIEKALGNGCSCSERDGGFAVTCG